ncbi:acyltransferase family protein [Parendozoicomonas sp. Alg238-R29]|uniref:acyltransferase n=1 Tax=Parendozoicomonas sp. Alg238-R29 TaxID=2993446 RepID=UPI00248DDF16|nr:acyltransferase family protein [Parendozoicomonas sp. Alg238-R29]
MKPRDEPKESYFFIELLRAVAAFAVIIIHVIGPYRSMIGQIPDYDWLAAVGFNVSSRWAVPVFIMITGALMLPDTRPFNLHIYLNRRIRRVVIPFLIWSVFYAFLAGLGWDSQGIFYDLEPALTLLAGLPEEATWYHLGFFYYFIPLYLVIPFLAPLLQKMSDDQLCMLILGWLVLTLFYLLGVESDWMTGVIMYGGYLLLGYALVRMPLNFEQRRALFITAGFAIVAGLYGVWDLSSAAGDYSPGMYTSYKTLNTVVVAAAVFVAAFYYGVKLQGKLRRAVYFIGHHSLGLYLFHPIVLWPIQNWELFPGLTLLTVPAVAIIVMIISLFFVWWLSKSKATAWLVP